jgi:hypothetical protein
MATRAGVRSLVKRTLSVQSAATGGPAGLPCRLRVDARPRHPYHAPRRPPLR